MPLNSLAITQIRKMLRRGNKGTQNNKFIFSIVYLIYVSIRGAMGILFLKHFSELAVDLSINRWEQYLETEITGSIKIEPAQLELHFTYWCDS